MSGACDSLAEEDRQTVRVMWPTSYDELPLPGGVVIVADGDVGDRPVYIARYGSLIGLLPHDGSPNGWNFGYGGDGPGRMARDVAAFLTMVDVPVDDVQRRVIEKMIETSSEDSLSLPLDRLNQTST